MARKASESSKSNSRNLANVIEAIGVAELNVISDSTPALLFSIFKEDCPFEWAYADI